MSKNDITGDSIRSKCLTEEGRKNFDAIFGQKDARAICYWPDGTWCDKSDVFEYTHMSDDYTTIQVSFEMNEDDVDRVVSDAIKGG